MTGGATSKPDLTADLIARAIVASAVSYGDDPIRAATSTNRGERRAVTAAISGLEAALGHPVTIARLASILNLSRWTVHDARKTRRPAFVRAAAAAEEAIRWAVKSVAERPSGELSARLAAAARENLVIAAALEAAIESAVDLVDFTLVSPPPPDGIAELEAAVVREANPVRQPTPAAPVIRKPAPLRDFSRPDLEAAERPAPRLVPERSPRPSSPYNPAHPRPAPAPPPKPRPQPDGRRKAPRGATVQRLSGGVEVIRLKPITDSIVKHAFAQVEAGLDVGEAADFFDVDADQLEARLAQHRQGRR